jgi:hypothetical protein
MFMCFFCIPLAASLAVKRPDLCETSFALCSARDNGVRIQDTTGGKGLGAFAGTMVLSGAWVGEYAGEILSKAEVEARYWAKRRPKVADRKWLKSRKARNQGLSGDYLFDMGDELYIDGEDADCTTWCRFMNHASGESNGETNRACNVETRSTRQIWDGEKIVQPRLWCVALRDIELGEEMCYDYGGEYWGD